jgi:hypothetical protein
MIFGNATVRSPINNDPDTGGGPIRRSPLVVARSGDGMPPHGWPQMVLRTPHGVVPDEESGGAAYPWEEKMKFLPDGRMVPAGALGGALGAALTEDEKALVTYGVVGGTLLGAAFGAFLSLSKWRGVGVGSVLGAGTGLVLSGLLRRMPRKA